MPAPIPAVAPSAGRVLRRMFLTLFLRGRSGRHLDKRAVPKSIGAKLPFTLLLHALVGLLAWTFWGRPVFTLSIYTHGMTLLFLGMFVATSAGEVLFNKEEADILMHRPVTARVLLWSKISVLVQVSLWLAGAFNLAALAIGVAAPDGGWWFLFAHAFSTVLAALFCTGSVVLVYQLCLRWFGRERLDGLMTTAQVLVTVAAVLGSQAVPRLIAHLGGKFSPTPELWWMGLLPPTWFASLDDALAGRGSTVSWAWAVFGLAITAGVLWLAFGKLARDYELGLRALNETTASPRGGRGGRWVGLLVNTAPLRWWLGDPATRAAFLLSAAYLARDRDVKLRIYPTLAPMLAMPLVFLFQDRQIGDNSVGVALAGGYLGLIPLLALNVLQHSQQWQAADLFRSVPLPGPGPLCHGARRAVLVFLALPALTVVALLILLLERDVSRLALLLPGAITLPLYAMIPCRRGRAVPLALPTELARSGQRSVAMFIAPLFAVGFALLAVWAWSQGWFAWFILGELVVVAAAYTSMRASLASARWPSPE